VIEWGPRVMIFGN